MMQVLRAVGAIRVPHEQERRVVVSHTRTYGKNSICYFALSEEKAYFFSASRKTIISYVLEGDVAVVAGDPIGPESELVDALKEFIEFCYQQDWTIVLWQVRHDLDAVYHSVVLLLLKIRGEDVINTPTSTINGGGM